MNNFNLECDGSGGIVLIEKDIVSTLSKELAAILNVVIDVNGQTELVFDYPGQEWRDVWSNELRNLNDSVKSGLMFVGLLDDGEYKVELELVNEPSTKECLGLVKVEKSPLLVVEAGELIQKVLYPQLELEIAYEYGLDKGNYRVYCTLQEEETIKLELLKDENYEAESNVVELSGRL